MGSSSILVNKSDRVLHLQFNRPEKKNALTLEMYGTIAETLRASRDDHEVRVVLVSGAGGSFTSGNDLGDFMNHPPTDADSPVSRFLAELVTFPKPLVAAVQGVAIGVGTTMLLHFDLVYAGESAVFQLPFARLGLCPEAASSYLMPRIMGHVRAMELLLLGDKFNAAKAQECGFLNEVCDDNALLDLATGKAHQIAELPPEAVRLTKSLMKRGEKDTIEQVIDVEGGYFMDRLRSPEAIEAFTAFAERRKPDFSKFN